MPTSLLAHITETSATLSRVALDGVAERVHVEPSERVDRQQLDLGALVLGEPVQRVEDRVVLDGGGQDPGAARVLGPARPEDALEREVVGLGAAGGEHHLAGPAAERPRDGLAGLLDDPAGGPSGGVQRGRVADVRSCSVIAATASGSIGVVAAWSR